MDAQRAATSLQESKTRWRNRSWDSLALTIFRSAKSAAMHKRGSGGIWPPSSAHRINPEAADSLSLTLARSDENAYTRTMPPACVMSSLDSVTIASKVTLIFTPETCLEIVFVAGDKRYREKLFGLKVSWKAFTAFAQRRASSLLYPASVVAFASRRPTRNSNPSLSN